MSPGLGPNGEVGVLGPDGPALYQGPELPRPCIMGGTAFWVDCPRHGAQPPHFKEARVHRGYNRGVETVRTLTWHKRPSDPALWGAMGPLDAERAVCARCVLPVPVPSPSSAVGAMVLSGPVPYAPVRRVKLREDRAAGSPEECNAACLNGRKTCNCRCLGLCHGAGSCACSVPGARAEHAAAMAKGMES